jgi:hypothetical protein
MLLTIWYGYLWLCLAIGIVMFLCFAVYDILCLLGYCKPDSKFGYSFGNIWGLTVAIILVCSLPVVNLVVLCWWVGTYISHCIELRKSTD